MGNYEAQAKGTSARKEAMKKVLANHAEEYATILGDEREARGLPREPVKNLSKTERLRQQLRAAGLEPVV